MSAHLDRFCRPPKALDGIKHDNVELVRSALRQTFSDPQERVEVAGFGGAPFSFANAVSILLLPRPTSKAIIFQNIECRWINRNFEKTASTKRLIRGASVVISPRETDPPRSLPMILLRILLKAFFTQEQIDCVVDDLKERAREESAKTRCFVSDSEWVNIDKV